MDLALDIYCVKTENKGKSVWILINQISDDGICSPYLLKLEIAFKYN